MKAVLPVLTADHSPTQRRVPAGGSSTQLRAQAPSFVQRSSPPGSAYGHPLAPWPLTLPASAASCETEWDAAPQPLSGYWQPVAFTPGRDVLGPEDAVWQQIIDTWDVPVLPPSPGDAKGCGRIGVKALMQALVGRLSSHHGWPKISVWVDGSAGLRRLGCRWAPKRPDDLDLLSFVQREAHQSLASLNDDIQTSYQAIVRSDMQLDETQMRGVRLRTTIIPSPESSSTMLLVKLGHGDDHVDARFVLADERYKPYAFRCNAVLFDLFNIASWAIMPGVDANAALTDINVGRYAVDHQLSDNSIMRAWKARCRGLIPATEAQDATLSAQLARMLDDLGEYDSFSVAYNLACFLNRELGDVQHNGARAKKTCALLINAIVHTQQHPIAQHHERVVLELRRLLERVACYLPEDAALTQVLHAVQSSETLAQWSLWSSLWAQPQATLSLPGPEAFWQITKSGCGERAYARVWLPTLGAFVVLPCPRQWPSFAHAPARAPYALDGDAPALTHAAHLLGDIKWQRCVSPDALADPESRREAAQRLVTLTQTITTGMPLELQRRIALAALHLSEHVSLSAELNAVLAQGTETSTGNISAIMRQRLRLGQRAVTLLAQDAPACAQTQSARARAWQYIHEAMDPSIAAAALDTLSHKTRVFDADVAPLLALLKAFPAPKMCTSAHTLAIYVRLRMLVAHDAHPDVRRALRSAVIAAQVQLHQHRSDYWLTCLEDAAAPSKSIVAFCALSDILCAGPDHISAATAHRVLTTLPAQGASPSHLRAACKALLRLTRDPAALRAAATTGVWADTLVRHPRTSAQTLVILTDFRCALNAKTAAFAAERWALTGGRCTLGRALLEHAGARQRLLDAATDTLSVYVSEADVLAHLQRISAVYSHAKWRAGSDYKHFIGSAIRRYGQLSVPASMQAAPSTLPDLHDASAVLHNPVRLSPRQVDVWLSSITYHQQLDFDLVLGVGLLHAHSGRRREALALLIGLAERALANNERPHTVVDAICAHSARLGDDDRGDDAPGLKGLARCITSAPSCHPQARVAAAILVQHATALLVEREAFELAIGVYGHAEQAWQLHGPSPALRRAAAYVTCPKAAERWRAMLRKAVLSAPAPHAFIALYDAMLQGHIADVTARASQMDQSELGAHLAHICRDACLRYRVVRYRPQGLLGRDLVALFQNPAAAHPAEASLFAPVEREGQRHPWTGLWMAWVEAGLTEDDRRLRALHIARHNGVDVDQMQVTQAALSNQDAVFRHLVLLPLLPQLCAHPDTQAFDFSRWNFIADLVLEQQAKFSWLFELCQASLPHERRLVSLLAFKLVKQIDSTKAVTPIQKTHMLQDGLRVMSFIVRALGPVDPRIATMSLTSVFKKLGDCVSCDPTSCRRLITELTHCKSVTSEHMAAIQVVDADFNNLTLRKARPLEAGRTPLLSSMHACDTESWLDTAHYGLLHSGLKQLFNLDHISLKEPDVIAASWRAHLAQSVRDHKLAGTVRQFLKNLPTYPLGHAKSGFALNLVFDALWDAQALSSDLVRVMLEEMPRTLENWRARPSLIELTEKMTLWACDLQPGEVDADIVLAAQAWLKKHKQAEPGRAPADALLKTLVSCRAPSP